MERGGGGRETERATAITVDGQKEKKRKNDSCINGNTHVYLRVVSATLRLSSCAMMDGYHVRQRSSFSFAPVFSCDPRKFLARDQTAVVFLLFVQRRESRRLMEMEKLAVKRVFPAEGWKVDRRISDDQLIRGGSATFHPGEAARPLVPM